VIIRVACLNSLAVVAGVALVGNAPDDLRQDGVAREVDELSSLNFAVAEVDLRNGTEAAEQLLAVDVIWVRGGNVFVLRRALSDSGADAVIVDLRDRDAVVYAGYSAGTCVLAADLHGLEGSSRIRTFHPACSSQYSQPLTCDTKTRSG
jgi:dipeptidase E